MLACGLQLDARMKSTSVSTRRVTAAAATSVTIMLSAMLTFTDGWSGVAYAAAAQKQPPVNPQAAQLKAFNDRVNRYVELRKKVEGSLPPLKETKDPGEMKAREQLLGDAIRAARADAKPGDVFGEDMRPIFLKVVREDWNSRSRSERSAAMSEVPTPASVKLRPNTRWPDGVALATTPPILLAKLQRLPDDVEYRFVGRHLVLRDAKANLIVDVLYDVLPPAPAT